jgi:Kef-type K+ transport system membrane component KefB
VDLFLLAAVTYLVIATAGYFINRHTRLPWMFTVVVFGMLLSSLGLFKEVTAGATFQLLAKLGMLFFLFTIGIDLEIAQIRKLGWYVVVGDIALTLTEGFLLALFFYFAFPQFVSHSFLVALIAGIAFGTVGEVVLLAILKEFKLEKTRFGQLALGIGVFDDVFEVVALAAIIALPAVGATGSGDVATPSSLLILLTLTAIVAATVVLARLSPLTRRYLERVPADSFVPPFLIFLVAYAFIYLGGQGFANMAVVAAIFSGIAVKQVLPPRMVEQYRKPIFFTANVFLGPFFFLSLGGMMSLSAIVAYPLLILAIITISLSTRLALSYLLFGRLLGRRQALVMGVGLTSKFSTSVVSENLLFSSGLIAQPLYSSIMAAFIILKPIIVGVFARGLALMKDEIGNDGLAAPERLPAAAEEGASSADAPAEAAHTL